MAFWDAQFGDASSIIYIPIYQSAVSTPTGKTEEQFSTQQNSQIIIDWSFHIIIISNFGNLIRTNRGERVR